MRKARTTLDKWRSDGALDKTNYEIRLVNFISIGGLCDKMFAKDDNYKGKLLRFASEIIPETIKNTQQILNLLREDPGAADKPALANPQAG